MNIHELKCFYITDSLHDYVNINARLLKNIDDSGSTSLRDKHDSITKLDWQYAHNGNRHWVKEFLPHLQSKLEEIMDNLGYQKPVVHELWFQQYSKNDTHDWHVHGHNFTGVYYVELDDAPKTELIMPYDQETIIVPEVDVGSILIFPSYVIHRAPVNRETRKTIVSFNFDASELSSTKLDKLHGENNV
jgi:hypothetical protein